MVTIDTDDKVCFRAGLLTIAEPLDREKKSQYILNITAEDSGVPKMAAYQRLLVSVEDVNDNRPMFDFPRYETSILENKLPGSPVLTVRATDRDEGQACTSPLGLPVLTPDLPHTLSDLILGDRMGGWVCFLPFAGLFLCGEEEDG